MTDTSSPAILVAGLAHVAAENQRARRGNRRGNRRGRGRGTQDNGAVHLPARERGQHVEPAADTNTLDLRSSNPSHASGNPGRGPQAGGFARRGRFRSHGPRAFGGHLTTEGAQIGTNSLAADAPDFVPGRPFETRAQKVPRVRRPSKSQASDIATRTHEDITNGHYECAICTNEVLPNSKIWSCKTCWSCLHLGCVKKWARDSNSTQQQQQAATASDALPPSRRWRCPGCNLPKDDLPDMYTCWCAKEIDPHCVPGLPPHSCGQTCSKSRAGQCPHPCELICHAGPCPPCDHMGPSISCFCGKEASSRRCAETNYEAGWSCAQLCGDLLPCGEHSCSQVCHEGVCGSCDTEIESQCYCGKTTMPLACSEREEAPSDSVALKDGTDGEIWTWTGSFNCGAVCRRVFDCGRSAHFCETICHVQDLGPAHCPYSPDVVTHCPCGKTPIEMLLSQPRNTCADAIPRCDKRCEKPLECGHFCRSTCHDGECSPCFQTTTIVCRCGRTTSNTLCHQDTIEPPQCARVCRANLNCGRHECGERCCIGEKKAMERQAIKRKHRALDAPRTVEENVEAEHICLRTCGRLLKCSNHNCSDLCHKGPCKACPEAVFEDIGCACGRTILRPPQPCGTMAPMCPFDCHRRRACGHPQTKHQCHTDTDACPKCPYLVEKTCVCGKRIIKNQPCWFQDAKCGLPCGKKLKCGIHTCRETCHRPGDCEDATSSCTQLCARRKTVCEHHCADTCHAPYPCSEAKPCQAKTFITCECQNLKEPAKCLASTTSEGSAKRSLDCDEDCLKLQRNAKLAAALNIDPATHQDPHVPYSQAVLDFYGDNTKVAQGIEREVRVFAADDMEKRLRFKPMSSSHRAYLHALAEDFGFDSESQDPEPHRHVCIFKTPKFVCAPMKTIGQCVSLRKTTVETSPGKNSSSTSQPAKSFNALILTDPRFGLTLDDLHSAISSNLSDTGLEIFFAPNGDVILHPKPSSEWRGIPDASLKALKASLKQTIQLHELASDVVLCTVDAKVNILVREEASTVINGWSQVAKGATRSKVLPTHTVGSKSSFTVLGTKAASAKKTKAPTHDEEAVDDWEKEVEAWN